MAAVGQLVKCVSHNNGEPLFPWERWFKKAYKFAFQKGCLYTMVYQDNKYYVIDRHHVPHEIEPKYFEILFRRK